MNFQLTHYGKREIGIAATLVSALCALMIYGAYRVCPYIATLLPLPMAVWLFVVWFFRDPERQTPAGEGLFISPADGNVSDITQIGPASILGRDGVMVGVFMNVFSVHVNRAPFDGRIDRVEHKEGAFMDVRDPAAYERNESAGIFMTVTHNGQEWPIVFRQVAGLVARRIVTDLAPGQQVKRGQRIGMIKFGSRVELYVPRELAGQVKVSVGQAVRAGETVLVAVAKESA